MKHLTFSLSLFITLLFTTQGIAQDYNPSSGMTTYPNGTIYAPNTSGGLKDEKGNPTDVVLTPDGDGGHNTITCSTHPELCKKALEEAADDAERRGNGTQSIKDGCGTLEDWRGRQGEWPMSPPIFFPDGRTPGIPLPPQRIAGHTDRIIRQIR